MKKVVNFVFLSSGLLMTAMICALGVQEIVALITGYVGGEPVVLGSAFARAHERIVNSGPIGILTMIIAAVVALLMTRRYFLSAVNRESARDLQEVVGSTIGGIVNTHLDKIYKELPFVLRNALDELPVVEAGDVVRIVRALESVSKDIENAQEEATRAAQQASQDVARTGQTLQEGQDAAADAGIQLRQMVEALVVEAGRALSAFQGDDSARKHLMEAAARHALQFDLPRQQLATLGLLVGAYEEKQRMNAFGRTMDALVTELVSAYRGYIEGKVTVTRLAWVVEVFASVRERACSTDAEKVLAVAESLRSLRFNGDVEQIAAPAAQEVG